MNNFNGVSMIKNVCFGLVGVIFKSGKFIIKIG